MKKTFGILNLLLAAAVFVGNYFYLTEGGLTLKTLCSGGFALMGLVNLCYVLLSGRKHLKFALVMSVGLILAMLGDIMIGKDFIIGAALFAGGHVCYFAGQCCFMKLKGSDFIAGGILFIGAGAYLLFCPLLTFPQPMMQWVCLVYALIISLMVGKGISNFLRRKTVVTVVLVVGCVLFFFSDLMLVFDWFMDGGKITGRLCMATYYPAECLLAYSVYCLTSRKQP